MRGICTEREEPGRTWYFQGIRQFFEIQGKKKAEYFHPRALSLGKLMPINSGYAEGSDICRKEASCQVNLDAGLGRDTLQVYHDRIQDTRATSVRDTDTRYYRSYCIRYDTFHLYIKILRYIRRVLIIYLYDVAANAYAQKKKKKKCWLGNFLVPTNFICMLLSENCVLSCSKYNIFILKQFIGVPLAA